MVERAALNEVEEEPLDVQGMPEEPSMSELSSSSGSLSFKRRFKEKIGVSVVDEESQGESDSWHKVS